jgi:hypothetical protein
MHFKSICTKLHTENNVSQMTSFLLDTHLEPLLKVLLRTLQHFLRQGCEFSTANTRCSTFQSNMATETALSELSTGSRRTLSTTPLPSTSHLKNMRFLCPTLYLCFITTQFLVNFFLYFKLDR